MFSKTQALFLQILALWLLGRFLHCHGWARYTFVVKEAPYTRLCTNSTILTVNGQFPGPTLHVNTGDTIIVDVHNQATINITLHWHGVKMPRYPWTDGPEYVTQCPIQPGSNFSQKIIFSDEEGTLWWHSHSDWSRHTLYGAIIISPKNGTNYPFPKPDKDVPIILGEWWKKDIMEVYKDFQQSGGDPNASDAYTINGQPGALQPCSASDAFKLMVDHGKTYLLRLINAALQEILFFAIRDHQLTVVGIDGAYTKPYKVDLIAISPGQTINVLLEANQALDHYYMAAKVFTSVDSEQLDSVNTTAIIQYNGNYTPSSNNSLPHLPSYNDTNALLNFTKNLKSLADDNHPISVPLNITKRMFFTLSMNRVPCENNSCSGPRGGRLAASVNNISFVFPETSILEAYYNNISGVYGDNFPSNPPTIFNFTSDDIPEAYEVPLNTTEVKVLEYNSEVELVFQGTNLVDGGDHPMHLHGYSFYVVGWGLGNFDYETDPLGFNLVDPPFQNTIAVPKNTWVAIRFKADNPGVWFMHCHIERHLSWGMDMAFIVKDGKGSDQKMFPPPPDMPSC